jgi:serine/threonine protein kinase
VDSFVRRFRDESRLHYKLSQGNLHIVRSIASGTTMAPATSALVPYTVLEWLEGRSLADEFTERRARGYGGRPLADVVKLLDSAVDAVAYAHAQGVVHRDLNPGNLFLASTPSGTKLKVLDFGVAKILADSALAMGPTARTLGNMRMFAPAYGAPEQFDDRVGVIGTWTDVYALALVVLEAMSDRGVVEGEHIGEFAMRALDQANRPTPRSLGLAVGNEVESVMSRATVIKPTERPRDAGEFWGMLKHAMRVDGPAAPAARVGPRRLSDRPPPTLRMEDGVPRGSLASPVIEVMRSSKSAPALGLGGTLRMPHGAGRSATEALAATPFPGKAAPGARPSAPVVPTPLPTSASEKGAISSSQGGAPALAMVSPPLSVRSTPPPRASRAPIVLIILLCLLVVAGLGGTGWFFFYRRHH